jgi:hypothetical protein
MSTIVSIGGAGVGRTGAHSTRARALTDRLTCFSPISIFLVRSHQPVTWLAAAIMAGTFIASVGARCRWRVLRASTLEYRRSIEVRVRTRLSSCSLPRTCARVSFCLLDRYDYRRSTGLTSAPEYRWALEREEIWNQEIMKRIASRAAFAEEEQAALATARARTATAVAAAQAIRAANAEAAATKKE